MGRIEMSEAEILEAIAQATAKTNDEGLTSEEIAALMGCNRRLALERVKVLAKQGRVVVGWKRDYRLDGLPCRVPVYRITHKEKPPPGMAP